MTERKCLTPGTVYETHVGTIQGAVRIIVDVRPPGTPQYQRDWLFNSATKHADELRDAIHDAIEPIVAKMQRLPVPAASPAVSALAHLNGIDDPIRITDERGNPGLTYTAQHVTNAFKAGMKASASTPPEATVVDAGEVETAAISLIVDLCGAGASQSSTNMRVVEDHLRQFAERIAARASVSGDQ